MYRERGNSRDRGWRVTREGREERMGEAWKERRIEERQEDGRDNRG